MLILWTQGDTNGIGSEVILKSFHRWRHSPHRAVVVGSYCMMKFYEKRLNLTTPLVEIESLNDIPMQEKTPDEPLYVLSLSCNIKANVGEIQADAGELSMKAVERAATLCLSGEADAMVTAPIHKEAIAKAGYPFQGHTDFLEHLAQSGRAQMLLCDIETNLKVALATVHIPLGKVSETLRASGLRPHLAALADALKKNFGIESPRLAVLGLNPHASDNGVIGKEETEFLQPELALLKQDFCVDGLFAADGFFGAKRYKEFDAVLALYHDQGLIPFKMLAFETGVNMTTGLPIVRTSPDHGTAFDIAGKGIANEASFLSATHLAIQVAERRRQQLETTA
jgi:4-hydroxythreonine-4-phosphate dehydrogenase